MLLSQYVAGLTPTSPGWATFEARPHLRNVSATVATTRGNIRLATELRTKGESGDRAKFHVMLVVPPLTTARLVLPHGSICGRASKVLVTVTQTPRHSSSVVAGGCKPLELPAGTWAVEAQCEHTPSTATTKRGDEIETSSGPKDRHNAPIASNGNP